MAFTNVFAIMKGIRQETGIIVSADITSTVAGKFGHASGYPISTVALNANQFIALIEVDIFYDFVTAAYTAGGNITANYTAGSAITGLISAANSVGAAVDKNVILVPLAAAGSNPPLATGISLVSSAAFTQPGTAAGIIKYTVTYRVINT